MRKIGLLGLLMAVPALAGAEGSGDDANRIVDLAYNHGQVVQTVAHLTDEIGGRLTNSPAMRQAEAWTQQQFKDYGLANVHKESFDFGRGWWMESSSLRMNSVREISPSPLVSCRRMR